MSLAAEARAAVGEVSWGDPPQAERPEVGSEPIPLRAELCFPAAAEVFAGHFPGHPVVPAVYLIEAACHAAGGRLAKARQAKFLREVGPDARVELAGQLEREGEGLLLEATLLLAGERAAQLLLELRD